jgi:hypothetical protein
MTDLTNTDTYYYINRENIKFDSDEERDNFIKYCEYMMFSNYKKPHPISDEDCKDYFRSLYKYIEMLYEEDILEQHYGKEREEKEQKENDEMKYYEDHHDYEFNINYDENIYLHYYFGLSKK